MSKKKEKQKKSKLTPIQTTTVEKLPIYSLTIHSNFQCESCGVCCATNWNIPVEKQVYETLHQHLKNGNITVPGNKEIDIDNLLIKTANLPERAEANIGRDELGRCLFFDYDKGNLCSIQHDVGIDSQPWVCRIFPRLCVLQPQGIFITLSHFCPVATTFLFCENSNINIIKNDPTFIQSGIYAGHDARTHLPPLLRPNVLMTWETYDIWERYAVEFMSKEDYTPEEALIVLITTVEKIRNWNGQNPPLLDFLKEILEKDSQANPAELKSQIKQLPCGLLKAKQIYTVLLGYLKGEINSFIPIKTSFQINYLFKNEPEAANNFIDDYNKYVYPCWAEFEHPIRKYLASKIFANFFAYQGNGLRTGLLAVVFALTSLRTHTTILCSQKKQQLNKDLLLEAFRYTDYLIHHSVSREQLIQFLNQFETHPIFELIAPIPD